MIYIYPFHGEKIRSGKNPISHLILKQHPKLHSRIRKLNSDLKVKKKCNLLVISVAIIDNLLIFTNFYGGSGGISDGSFSK